MSQMEFKMAPPQTSRLSTGVANPQYVYTDRQKELKHMVQFGRTTCVSASGISYIVKHFNGRPSADSRESIDVTKRVQLYYTDSRHYVVSAIESGRTLTNREWEVLQSWDDPGSVPDVSVAHILGSGFVQNLLNRMIVQFQEGKAIFVRREDRTSADRPLPDLAGAQRRCAEREEEVIRLTKAGKISRPVGRSALLNLERAQAKVTEAARPVMSALAAQAAAVARLQGIGRAIMAEEPATYGYGEKLDPETATTGDKFRLMARDIDVVLGNVPDIAQEPAAEGVVQEPDRQQAYYSFMMHTVDSSGNLRLGSRVGNSAVGAGFDMPLTCDGQPTDRGLRLYAALRTFGLPEMEKCTTASSCGDTYHTGHFTTDLKDRRLSSSVEVSDDLQARAVETLQQLRGADSATIDSQRQGEHADM